MKTARPLAALAALLASLAGASRAASAAEAYGQDFPDQIEVDGRRLLLNGIGVRLKSIFAVKVYVAALYSEKPTQDEKELLSRPGPKRIVVRFLRKIPVDLIVDSWNDGFKNNCDGDCRALDERLARLNSYMKETYPGEEVVVTFHNDRFSITTDGTTRVIEGRDFADMVLSTFIGRSPPTQEVKDGLLGRIPASSGGWSQRGLLNN